MIAAPLRGMACQRLPSTAGRDDWLSRCIPSPVNAAAFADCGVSGLEGQLHQPGMECQVERSLRAVALSGQLLASARCCSCARVGGYAFEVMVNSCVARA